MYLKGVIGEMLLLAADELQQRALERYQQHSVSSLKHCFVVDKEAKTDICIAHHSKKLTAEALRCGSHSFRTANTSHLSSPRKHSPNGTTNSDSSILITAYYSLIDPERMKG